MFVFEQNLLKEVLWGIAQDIMHVTCSRLLARGRFQCGFSCGSVTQSIPSGVSYLLWPGCWETSVFLASCTEVGQSAP